MNPNPVFLMIAVSMLMAAGYVVIATTKDHEWKYPAPKFTVIVSLVCAALMLVFAFAFPFGSK